MWDIDWDLVNRHVSGFDLNLFEFELDFDDFFLFFFDFTVRSEERRVGERV